MRCGVSLCLLYKDPFPKWGGFKTLMAWLACFATTTLAVECPLHNSLVNIYDH